jgi:hypothetical protein
MAAFGSGAGYRSEAETIAAYFWSNFFIIFKL